MSYNFEWLLTVAECETLAEKIKEETDALDVQIVNLQQRQKQLDTNAKEVADEIESTQTQLDSLAVTLPTMPEGKVKKRNLKSQRQLMFQQGNLADKKESLAPGTRLDNQLDLSVAQLVRAEKQVFLDGVLGRKAAL
jgi:seryl-tRNA synthetase